MPPFKPGEIIAIPCDVRPGPFSDELLVTVDTEERPISGFVHKSELRERDGHWFVRAFVIRVGADSLDVRIKGSFFNTNGIASIPRQTAVAA